MGNIKHALAKPYLTLVFTCTFTLAISLLFFNLTFANIASWSQGEPRVSSPYESPTDTNQWCSWQKAEIYNRGQQNVCLSQGANVRIGYDNNNRFHIAVGFDEQLYPLSTNGDSIELIPDTDTLIIKKTIHNSKGLAVYRNVLRHIQRSDLPEIKYTLEAASYDFTLKDQDQNFIAVENINYSQDGKWMSAFSSSFGWIKSNTTTGESRIVIDPFQYRQYSFGAISNSGQYLAIVNAAGENKVYSVSDSCGVEIGQNISQDQQCSHIAIPNLPQDGGSNPNVYPSTIKFIEGDSQLQVRYWSNTSGKFSFYTVSQPGYTSPEPLKYLALGDSYSSGEGDTQKNPSTGKKYYRGWTDLEESPTQPREKCHISTRSYPYKLANGMGLGQPTDNINTKWQSVACGGAQVYDMSAKNSDEYEGQSKGAPLLFWSDGGEPRLKEYNKEELKNQAINEFIPGRQKQIEFVKKYQPKVVTLTVGGNDVDFGEKLASCATSPRTCDESLEQGKKEMGASIKKQFNKLAKFYTEIKEVSPSTKVYVLGYPQIILDRGDVQCPVSTAGLNIEEKKLMTAGYWYINQVVKTAAAKTGVKYIDVSNALVGHRLCESEQVYTNGVVHGAGTSDERQESFHPNADGHSAIANAVWDVTDGQSLIDYDGYPSGPNDSITEDDIPDSDYLQTASPVTVNSEQKEITREIIAKGEKNNVILDENSIKPNSPITATLFSDPVHLGNFVSTSEGSLRTAFTIPDSVPAGYHNLALDGESYSGEPIRFSQTILVTGSNPSDIDENDVLDTEQVCGPFIEVSRIDQDGDGHDDACDPEIDESTLYRARNGDSQKQEDINDVYVERNTNKAHEIGISDDYDADGDGWSIVAKTQREKIRGTVTNFWIDEQNIPHVSVRTDSRGCVQLTPRSLKQVKEGKIKKFKVELKNTNSCRKENNNQDTDSDGIPDNQQALYRVRNGDSLIGENVDDVYLERNFTAAEAQLGLSDYSHTNQWNVVAKSHNDQTRGTFVKMVMDSDKNPTVLVKNTTKNKKGISKIACNALQPLNTKVIVIDKVRKFKKIPMPEGENCNEE